MSVTVAAAVKLDISQYPILDFKLDGLAASALGSVGVFHWISKFEDLFLLSLCVIARNEAIQILKLTHKLLAINHKAFMGAFANQRLVFKAHYLEDQPSAVHLNKFGLAADNGTYWAGF